MTLCQENEVFEKTQNLPNSPTKAPERKFEIHVSQALRVDIALDEAESVEY